MSFPSRVCLRGGPRVCDTFSQVNVVGSAAVRGVDRPGRRALGPGEGHVLVHGVLRVRDAAAGAAPGPVQARHFDSSRRPLLIPEPGPRHLLDARLPAVLPPAAPADPDEHDEAAQDFKDPADVAQDDAVADLHGWVRRRSCVYRHRRDGPEYVGVPGDGYDGHDSREEYQQSAQAGQDPVGPVFPAADPRDGHRQPDQSHDEGGHHQTPGDLDDLLLKIRGVLQAAIDSRVDWAGPADLPDALLEELVGRAVLESCEGPPVWGHGRCQVQDQAAGSQNHPEDQDARGAHG